MSVTVANLGLETSGRDKGWMEGGSCLVHVKRGEGVSCMPARWEGKLPLEMGARC